MISAARGYAGVTLNNYIMGGCCCSSTRSASVGAPVYIYHQQNPASTIVAIDKNLDTSTPDTYRAPPTPLPYDVGLVVKDNPDLEKSGIKRKIHDHKESLMMDENESLQKCVSEDKPDEDDVCPICLEEYDEENPRSMTKCEHHFHLCCILEWMERSETCPVCDQITMIDAMYE